VKIERWDAGGVVLTRYETEGISAGLSARYEGQISGNRIVNGVVTWTGTGDTGRNMERRGIQPSGSIGIWHLPAVNPVKHGQHHSGALGSN
jgi:hypothetical protein